MEVLAQLQPVFRENGKVTAGNSCPLNDGAAAVVLMSDQKAKELGVKPIARVIATGVSALEPEFMGLGPIEASRQALKRAGSRCAFRSLACCELRSTLRPASATDSASSCRLKPTCLTP